MCDSLYDRGDIEPSEEEIYYGLWKTRDGRLLKISEMETSHIQNTINLLKSKGYFSSEDVDNILNQDSPDHGFWDGCLFPCYKLDELQEELDSRNKVQVEMTKKSITVNQTFEISIGTHKVQLTLQEVQELQDELNRILGKNVAEYPKIPIFPEMHKTNPENPAWPKRPGNYEVWCNDTTKPDNLQSHKEFGE